jgi:predicted  nucleic acid-binding Zn-ribbon protein
MPDLSKDFEKAVVGRILVELKPLQNRIKTLERELSKARRSRDEWHGRAKELSEYVRKYQKELAELRSASRLHVKE